MTLTIDEEAKVSQMVCEYIDEHFDKFNPVHVERLITWLIDETAYNYDDISMIVDDYMEFLKEE